MTDRAFVDGLLERSRGSEAHVRRLGAALSLNQLNWKPAPARWSVGQCLDHILSTNRPYLARIEESLVGARPARPDRRFRPGPFGGRFAAALGPDVKRKMKTPGTFAPSSSAIPLSVVEELAEQQAALREIFERSLAVDLSRTKVASPVSRLIRFRLGDILVLLTGHQERHLLQAERVREEQGFPAAGEET